MTETGTTARTQTTEETLDQKIERLAKEVIADYLANPFVSEDHKDQANLALAVLRYQAVGM